MRRVMLLMLAAGIAACGHGKQSGPAWPTPSTTADDGGESIEPRASSAVAAAIEKADEPEDKDAADPTEEKVETAAPSKDEPGQAPSASQPTQDDVIMTDEIIIEIED